METSATAGTPGIVAQALHAVVTKIPASTERPNLAPALHAQSLAKGAALKAGALSGGLTLPPGPFGLATVLPDLFAVWRIQQQLVADIAATFGRTDALTRETMLICLFKHGGVAITQRLLSRHNDSIVVHRIASRALQHMLEKIAVRVAQRLAAKSVSRWLPILGAVGAGAYAYFDTAQVAKNAIELFSQPLQLEPASDPPAPPDAPARTATATADALEADTTPARRRSRRPRTKTTTPAVDEAGHRAARRRRASTRKS